MQFRSLFLGFIFGAATAYYLDPRLGKRRRALVRDKAVHYEKASVRYLDKHSRDLGNRARGVFARARSSVRKNALVA